MGNQCAELGPSLAGVLAEAKDFTVYAVIFRYLDAPHEPDAVEATSALQIAGRLYERIRSLVQGAESSAPTATALGHPLHMGILFFVLHEEFGGRFRPRRCACHLGCHELGALSRAGSFLRRF